MKINRRLEDLDKEFLIKVNLFLNDKRIKDDGVFITETFRTEERQKELFAKGRTTPGRVVTRLDGVKSKSIHQLGKAFDIAFRGPQMYPSDFKRWRLAGDVAKEYGIDWGYDLWGKDKCHFQNDGTMPAKNLLNNYKNMNLKEEFEENNFKALRLVVSNMRKATDNDEFKEKLAEFGKYMDKIKK